MVYEIFSRASLYLCFVVQDQIHPTKHVLGGIYRLVMFYNSTVNFLNIRTPKKFVVITLKFELWLYHRVMSPNHADGLANSVDPDHTAPLGAV